MKAILTLDETPKNCTECPLVTMDWDDDYEECYICSITRDFNIGWHERPKTCPLIEINDNIAKLIEVAR